jgi:hypothetical protein
MKWVTGKQMRMRRDRVAWILCANWAGIGTPKNKFGGATGKSWFSEQIYLLPCQLKVVETTDNIQKFWG